MRSETDLDPDFEFKDDDDLLNDVLLVVGISVFTMILAGTFIAMAFARHGFFDGI